MNTDLRKKSKTGFEKYFFRLMNDAVLVKTMENVRKHRYIKPAPIGASRNYSESEANYHTTKIFSENLLAMEVKKTQMHVNKPVYLGLSILELSKIVMYEFWYDYVNSKDEEKTKSYLQPNFISENEN